MALPHGKAGEPLDVGPLGDNLREAKSAALFKSKDLEVMRLVLPAGRVVPTHSVPGEVTVQCIEGSMELLLSQGPVPLSAGELLLLAAGQPHGVRAVTACSALVTIALRG